MTEKQLKEVIDRCYTMIRYFGFGKLTLEDEKQLIFNQYKHLCTPEKKIKGVTSGELQELFERYYALLKRAETIQNLIADLRDKQERSEESYNTNKMFRIESEQNKPNLSFGH